MPADPAARLLSADRDDAFMVFLRHAPRGSDHAERARCVAAEAERRQRAADLAIVFGVLDDTADRYTTDVFPEDSTSTDARSARFARSLLAGLRTRPIARLGPEAPAKEER